jgi:release factor glutamine methyltransferase
MTGDAQAMALRDLTDQVRRRLRDAGIEPAAREARQLIGTLAKLPPEAFIGHPEQMVSAADCARVFGGLSKRVQGMPLGRIAGSVDFYGRPFELGPAILEPRADSEVLIDAALEIVHDAGLKRLPLRIVDVGTGSGCLLVTLLAELPDASGVGVDISGDALVVSRKNAQINGVADRVEFIEGDALGGVAGSFDILISNPPYICSVDIASLDIEVLAHDPRPALDGGADGMDIYRRIATESERVVPDGWMLFEVGAGMAEAVCHEIDLFCQDSRPRTWKVWQDFNGHARCVAAKTLNVL